MTKWRVEKNGDHWEDGYAIFEGDECIATTQPDSPEKDDVGRARLIGAAPELLEALEALVKWMDDSGLSSTKPAGVYPLVTEPVEYSVVTDARTAIRKTRGES